MIVVMRTLDHPEANGRVPLQGEQQWVLSFPLENGDDYLEIKIGKRGHDALTAMLMQEKIDSKEQK